MMEWRKKYSDKNLTWDEVPINFNPFWAQASEMVENNGQGKSSHRPTFLMEKKSWLWAAYLSGDISNWVLDTIRLIRDDCFYNEMILLNLSYFFSKLHKNPIPFFYDHEKENLGDLSIILWILLFSHSACHGTRFNPCCWNHFSGKKGKDQ